MLAEFLTKLIEVSKAAQQPVKIADPAAKADRFILPGGTEKLIIQPTKPKRYSLLDRESLVNAIVEQLDKYDCTALVDATGVTVVSDDYHDNCLKLDFEEMWTTAWENMPRGAAFRLNQREMIDWIREKMDGTGLDVLLPMLRTVEFSRAEQSAGVVQRGKESLGRSVEAAVGNADTFPSFVNFNVSMLTRASGFHLSIELRLNIEPLAAEQKFKLWINSDDVTDALWSTLRHTSAAIFQDVSAASDVAAGELGDLKLLLGECI